MTKPISAFFLSCIVLSSFGQDSTTVRLKKQKFMEKERNTVVVPSIYFTPETNWYFGGAMYSYFKTNKTDTTLRISQIRGAIGYSLNKQIVFWLPAEFYFKQNEYKLKTEIGYYKWPYVFNGIGNTSTTFYSESYTASFPRLRVDFQKQILKNFFVGPRYWFQKLNVLELDSSGILWNDKITGYNGGISSGFGVGFIYDTRDFILGPTGGVYAELSTLYNSHSFGGTFNYRNYAVDFRKYFKFKYDQILAFQFFSKMNFGNAPFNQLGLLGGSNRLRGYQQGRFRDNHMIETQVEYRSPYAYNFIGMTAFVGAGIVSDKIQNYQLQNMKYAGGLGMRLLIDPENRLAIRMDYAVGQGKENRQFYITVSEAF